MHIKIYVFVKGDLEVVHRLQNICLSLFTYQPTRMMYIIIGNKNKSFRNETHNMSMLENFFWTTDNIFNTIE